MAAMGAGRFPQRCMSAGRGGICFRAEQVRGPAVRKR